MSQVHNSCMHNYIQPITFMAVAYFAGSKRFIVYFPGASRRGLYLAAGLGVGATLASSYLYTPTFFQTHDKESGYHSFVRVATTLTLGVMGAYGFTRLFKGRVSLCEHAAVRFITLELLVAGVLTGISVCLEEGERQKTLEQRHTAYQKDPDAWKRLSQEERVAFAEECFAADKGLAVLPLKTNTMDPAAVVQRVEDFSTLNKNQLEWFTEIYRCEHLKLDLVKEFGLNIARHANRLDPVWVEVTLDHVHYAWEHNLQSLLEGHKEVVCEYFIENVFKVHQDLNRMAVSQDPYLVLKDFLVCMQEGVKSIENLVVFIGRDSHFQEMISKFLGPMDQTLASIKGRMKEFSAVEQASLVELITEIDASRKELVRGPAL